MEPLAKLAFNVVGYGCTTAVSATAGRFRANLQSCHWVRPGRGGSHFRQPQFEGRVHPLVKANYLASPPLVVALPWQYGQY